MIFPAFAASAEFIATDPDSARELPVRTIISPEEISLPTVSNVNKLSADTDTLADAFEGVEMVYHAAASVSFNRKKREHSYTRYWLMNDLRTFSSNGTGLLANRS
ncbi:hypothetical protein EON64_02460 [archaeon]|nr:MAG: hypothetical protein EON64_02460 [archaeon]